MSNHDETQWNVLTAQVLPRMKKLSIQHYQEYIDTEPTPEEIKVLRLVIPCLWIMVSGLAFYFGGYIVFVITHFFLIMASISVGNDIERKFQQKRQDIIKRFLDWEAVHQPTAGDIMSKIEENLNQAITVGNITVNGDGNPVVIGPGTIEIVHGTKTSDPELAKALTLVVGHLEDTNNKEAARAFDEFSKQLKQDEPNKTIIKALWDAVLTAAPALKSMADATAAITKLF